jgi:hypothetical protein
MPSSSGRLAIPCLRPNFRVHSSWSLSTCDEKFYIILFGFSVVPSICDFSRRRFWYFLLCRFWTSLLSASLSLSMLQRRMDFLMKVMSLKSAVSASLTASRICRTSWCLLLISSSNTFRLYRFLERGSIPFAFFHLVNLGKRLVSLHFVRNRIASSQRTSFLRVRCSLTAFLYVVSSDLRSVCQYPEPSDSFRKNKMKVNPKTCILISEIQRIQPRNLLVCSSVC